MDLITHLQITIRNKRATIYPIYLYLTCQSQIFLSLIFIFLQTSASNSFTTVRCELYVTWLAFRTFSLIRRCRRRRRRRYRQRASECVLFPFSVNCLSCSTGEKSKRKKQNAYYIHTHTPTYTYTYTYELK